MHDTPIVTSSDADRTAWRGKALAYIEALTVPRAFDKDEACRMVNMTWHKAHQEGLEDAIMLLLDLAADKDDDERELIRALADSIEALRAKNDEDARRIQGFPDYRPELRQGH